MSDTPLPDPLDEQANDLFDAGADAPGDEPEVGARLDEYRRVRDALVDVPPPDDTRREQALAAALSLFDELALETVATGTDDAPAADEPSADEPTVVTPVTPDEAPRNVTPLTAARSARSGRHTTFLVGAAAAVVLVLGVAFVVRSGDTGSGNVDSASPAVIDGDGGFSSSKSAGDDAPRATPEGGGGSDSTAAAAADSSVSTAAAASTAATSIAVATASGATTTASAGGATGRTPPAETTSTTDARDASTTSAFTTSTTSPPTTTSTNVDAGALPYLGELTTADDLATALRPLPPFDATDAGAAIRSQLATGVCDVRPYGTPIAVARWNGRDSVVMRSATAPIVQLIPLDGCNPIVQLDAPS